MIPAMIILLALAGCTAYQYLKGTALRAAVTVFTLITATVVAFAFFEKLAQMLVSQISDSSPSRFVPYAYPLIFVLLLIISFAVLQTAALHLARRAVVLAPLPEKIGRLLCGAITGFILAGLLIIALAMTPIKNNIPYQRFSGQNPDPEKPSRAPLNIDALPPAIFGMTSRGGLAGKNSFPLIHPSIVDEAFLNRLSADQDISSISPDNAIEVPASSPAWLAPPELKTTDGNPVNVKPGQNLIVVRVGFRRNAGSFSLSQLRLVCNEKENEPLSGAGLNVYPIGYFAQTGQIHLKKLSEKIIIFTGTFKGVVKYVDFLFTVPSTHIPVLVAYKQNNIVTVPKLITTEDAPPVEGL